MADDVVGLAVLLALAQRAVVEEEAHTSAVDVRAEARGGSPLRGSGDRSQREPEGRIVDLSDPANPVVVGSFPSSHNIFIDADGLMYLEVPGLRIVRPSLEEVYLATVAAATLPLVTDPAAQEGSR